MRKRLVFFSLFMVMTFLLSSCGKKEEVSLNPYLGSNKLDGDGIPADFFQDVHIRKAFAYCFLVTSLS